MYMQLEDFIKQHRPQFEQQHPVPDFLWARIEQQLAEQATVPPALASSRPSTIRGGIIRYMGRPLRTIAAGIALLAVGTLSGIYIGKQSAVPQGIPTEVAEAAHYYEAKSRERMSQLAAYNPQVEAALQTDLACLDSIMYELKAELEHTQPEDRARVVHALIKNYKTKVRILEHVLAKEQAAQQWQQHAKDTPRATKQM